jgi:LPS sulfotransferase NodH
MLDKAVRQVADLFRGWIPYGSPAQPVRPPGFENAFALIGCQRTGTHLLREILNTNPAIAVMAEVFSQYPHRAYWQNFLRRQPASRFPPQRPAEAAALLDEYFEVVRRDVHRRPDWYGGAKPKLKTVGLDIKYNQLRFVAPVFGDITARPLLLSYMSDRGIGIVHLIRRNLMHTAISIIIANQRNLWQNYDGRKIDGKFQIPPKELLIYMRWVAAERGEFQRLAYNIPIFDCYYEDLVVDLARVHADAIFPSDTTTLGPLATFLNVPNEFRHRGNIHKAINKPYPDVIENYDEVLRTVEDSEFAEFATSSKAA